VSGIAGIFHRDGSPAEPVMLEQMMAAMALRGPDRSGLWMEGSIGFGHAALFSTAEAAREAQPMTIDGQVWITADARIDEREHLRRTLLAQGRPLPPDVTDVEYILHSYYVWGEACGEHLIGDFAFAIWDGRTQQLLCCRDHMGVKPFYYFLSDRLFIFASDVRTLLANPMVPRRINEGRIADYLMEYLEGIDKTSTFYLDVLRMPPATRMQVGREHHHQHIYWMPNPTHELQYRSDSDYAEAFLEVFTEAVICRLRSPERVGSMLSGGLDSSSIVAVARDWLKAQGNSPLHTFSAITDEAGSYIDATFIRSVIAQDHVTAHLLHPNEASVHFSALHSFVEPGDFIFDNSMIMPQLMYRLARQQGFKVLLDGLDGDLVMTYSENYLGLLLRQGMWSTAWQEAKGYSHLIRYWGTPAWKLLYRHARSVFIPRWLKVSTWPLIREQRMKHIIQNAYINPTFARKIDLRQRMAQFHKNVGEANTLRGERLRRLQHPYISIGLERYDRVAAAQGIEPRHPYLDKRLVEFSLALPWEQITRQGWTKYIVRQAMQERLPEAVRWRVIGLNHAAAFWNTYFQYQQGEWTDPLLTTALNATKDYVHVGKSDRLLPLVSESLRSSDCFLGWKLVILGLWLHNSVEQ
jgi:asparagine synthase (glutamine-hydrolysing)